jgi:hypothetical protein
MLPKVPNEVQFTWEDWQVIAFKICVSLACVSTHCPDLHVRAFAKRQLANPFWDFAMYENRDLEEKDFVIGREWKRRQAQ